MSCTWSVLHHSDHRSSEKNTQECSQLGNGTTYSLGDLAIPIKPLCNQGFDYTQVQSVVYVDSYLDCLSACINIQSVWPCVGIQFENGTIGPNGGSMCWLLWNSTTNSTVNNDADSALFLLNSTSSSSAVEYLRTVLI